MRASSSDKGKICNPRRLAGWCTCFLLGVFVSFFVEPPRWLWCIALASGTATLLIRRLPKAVLVSSCVVFALIGAMLGTREFHADRFVPKDKGVLTGTVIEISYHEYNKSQLILTGAYIEDLPIETNVVLTVYGSFDAKIADDIRCTVKLRVIENYEDATFDYRTWRLSENIAYQATGSNAAVLGHNPGIGFWPARFADKLNAVMTTMYGDKAGMAIGMTLGNTEQMTEDELAVFRAAGIAHVLSVSGLNFAFFLMALQWLLGKRTYGSTGRLLITLALLWAYCAVVGWPSSAVRACLMLSLYLLANWAGWQYDLLTSILFAAAIIAAFRPAQIFTAGFCLSFSATLGIALFYPSFVKALGRLKFIPKRIGQALGVWASAQMGIMPFMIYFFHTVQLYGAFGNLLAVPLSSIVTVGGLLSGLVGLIFLPAGKAIAWVVGWVCAAIETLARLFAALPAAQIALMTARLSLLFGWCFAAVVLSRYCLLPRRAKMILAGLGAAIAIVVPV